MALQQLFARSPRSVLVTGVASDLVRCDLYIWNSPASIPATPTLTLSKPIPSTLATTVFFNISPYVRNYITHTSFTEIASQAVVPVANYCYCTAKTYLNNTLVETSEFICFDGYGYFDEASNPSLSNVLMTPNEFYVKENDNSGSVSVFVNSLTTLEARYTQLGTGATTNVALSGIIKQVPMVHSSYTATGNTLRIFNTSGSVTLATFTFTTQCEPRYTPIECDFVNKFGMWQRLIFFKAKRNNIEVSGTDWRLMPQTPIYNTTVGYDKVMNINAKEIVRLNTGWVEENVSEAIQQLMLSEVILLDNKPVKMKTKSIEKFKKINDKMINYLMEFEYANDIINNVM
jgi:hypothetical protein